MPKKFEIILIFVIKLFFLHDWKVKIKYIQNKKSFQDEIKSIFHYFQTAFMKMQDALINKHRLKFCLKF